MRFYIDYEPPNWNNYIALERGSKYGANALKQRNCKTDSVAIGVIRELNQKWNSVVEKVNKKFGVKTLKRNVIWNVYIAENENAGYARKPD